MEKKLLFIYNPNSGRELIREYLSYIVETLSNVIRASIRVLNEEISGSMKLMKDNKYLKYFILLKHIMF